MCFELTVKQFAVRLFSRIRVPGTAVLVGVLALFSLPGTMMMRWTIGSASVNVRKSANDGFELE